MKRIIFLIKRFRFGIFSEYLPMLVLVSILFSLVYIASERFKPSAPDTKVPEGTLFVNLPTLNLPLRYFPSESFRSGTVGKSIDDKSTWKSAAIDIGYQSFPTTTITLSSEGYSNEIKDLPPIKSLKEALSVRLFAHESEALIDVSYIRERRLAQIQEYGTLASRFLPYDNIGIMGSFDADNDGVDEMILAVCGEGGNHCPHEVIIIKGDKIIFSTRAGGTGPRIVTSDTPNGFYLQWAPWQPGDGGIWDVGLCCLPGYMKTRFVYEDGKFIPVYEQEVLYINVKNTEQ